MPSTRAGRAIMNPHDLPPPHCIKGPRAIHISAQRFQVQPPKSGMSTRSHQGCWTCKRRRRRCDNARPSCQNCAERGTFCEGYEVRLRWGAGIASRGHFAGADKPVNNSVSSRPRGRQRDLSRERRRRVEQKADSG
ncbi:unnamed protein product [Penicillium egyptiacum]|uniref:Zn(2)-C6 fungal-type domain-containing protein n=1 Tax=Penicillium egyptiacum TaxID=1303716 RepID=A0A9W4KQI1_9EURO|nr:unnamed protein product [Penicillium egyptiacum]